MSAPVIDFAQRFREAGRGFVIIRQTFGAGDVVRVRGTQDIGVVERYLTNGKVRVYLRGVQRAFDQDQIEAADAGQLLARALS